MYSKTKTLKITINMTILFLPLPVICIQDAFQLSKKCKLDETDLLLEPFVKHPKLHEILIPTAFAGPYISFDEGEPVRFYHNSMFRLVSDVARLN